MQRLYFGSLADINIQNNDGSTALIEAVQNANVEIIRLLTEKGADINLKNNKGETALDIATRKLNVEPVRSSIQNMADINLKNNKGETALNIATRKNYIEIGDMIKDFIREEKNLKQLVQLTNKEKHIFKSFFNFLTFAFQDSELRVKRNINKHILSSSKYLDKEHHDIEDINFYGNYDEFFKTLEIILEGNSKEINIEELEGYMEIFDNIYEDYIGVFYLYINELYINELEKMEENKLNDLKQEIRNNCKNLEKEEDKLNNYIEKNKEKKEEFNELYKKYIKIFQIKKDLLKKYCSIF